jgi:hypothetical protein
MREDISNQFHMIIQSFIIFIFHSLDKVMVHLHFQFICILLENLLLLKDIRTAIGFFQTLLDIFKAPFGKFPLITMQPI